MPRRKAPPATPKTELWDMDMGMLPVPLVLAPGIASGYKRVKKINDETFQAQRAVGGKQQQVWVSDDPRECAYVLARLELEPLSKEQIKAACKDAAKLRRQRRNDKRFREDLTRRIDAAYESMIVKPKRAKEAAKRAAAEAKACREREADMRLQSL